MPHEVRTTCDRTQEHRYKKPTFKKNVTACKNNEKSLLGKTAPVMQPSVTVGFEQSFVLYLQGTKKNK